MKRGGIFSFSSGVGSTLGVLGLVAGSAGLTGCANNSGEGFAHVGQAEGGAGAAGADPAQEKLDACNVPPMEGPVVIGYVPSWVGDFEGLWNSLDLDTLTHINLAFTNPGADGKTELPWIDDALLISLIKKAHDKNVKVMASLGGINDSEAIAEHLADDMDAYVDDLEDFVNKFDLDGVDVDIEGDSVNATYGPFVRALADRLRPQGKLITAAVGGWFAQGVVDEALFCFDFVNEMSYDAAGGWTGPEEHSSRKFARQRALYWTGTRGYPAERTVIGVPFYGYCWGSDCRSDGSQIRFSSIYQQFPDGLGSDWIRPEGMDLQINYNSPATLTYKAELSKQYGGIMIWDMSQDSDDHILMEAIRVGLAD